MLVLGQFLRRDGSLVGWGGNYYGQTNVPAGNDFISIAAGRDHNLALKSDGSIVGWGRNDFGQVNVPTGTHYVAIAAGGRHSLAIQVPEPGSWALLTFAGCLGVCRSCCFRHPVVMV